MIITLKKLTLINFKGAAHREIVFGDNTRIEGANRTGKSTIADAWMWLLFGKNTEDEKVFAIKPIIDGVQLSKVDNEVEAVLDVDGVEETLRRVNHEKWATRRGSLEQEYTGDETLCFWNGVPMKVGEFNGAISKWIRESEFKLLTNVGAFNAMKWQDRREKLVSLVQDVRNSDVTVEGVTAENLAKLVAILDKKGLDGYRKELQVKKKGVRDALDGLPTRIDEVRKGMVAEEWKELEAEKEAQQALLDELDSQLSSASKRIEARSSQVAEKSKEIAKVKEKIAGIESAIKSAVNSGKLQRQSALQEMQSTLEFEQRKLTQLAASLTKAQEEAQKATGAMTTAEVRKNDKLTEWKKLNAEAFVMNPEETCCPTCKRELEANSLEVKRKELEENWNKEHSEKLAKVKSAGSAYKAEVDTQAKALADANSRAADIAISKTAVIGIIAEYEGRIKAHKEEELAATGNEEQALSDAYAESDELMQEKMKLDALVVEAAELEAKDTEDLSGLREQRALINTEITRLNAKLAGKGANTRAEKRIAELEEESALLNKEYTGIEKLWSILEKFERAKMDLLEGRINERFRYTRFRLFETLVDGTKVPACVTLIKGVPYSDANTASKMNCGLDIINTFSEVLGVSAPIFIDNRESVTNIIPVKAQVVNLIVNAAMKELEVTAE